MWQVLSLGISPTTTLVAPDQARSSAVPAISDRCTMMPKSSSHLEQACMRGSAGTSKQCHSQSLRCTLWLSYRLTFIMPGSGEYCCVQHFAASLTFWHSSNCETHADPSENVTPSTPHSGPSLSSTRAPFNGSLVTLQFALDQPKPRPRPLAALVPLPILLPLADGMVPRPLPTEVPAAV